MRGLPPCCSPQSLPPKGRSARVQAKPKPKPAGPQQRREAIASSRVRKGTGKGKAPPRSAGGRGIPPPPSSSPSPSASRRGSGKPEGFPGTRASRGAGAGIGAGAGEVGSGQQSLRAGRWARGPESLRSGVPSSSAHSAHRALEPEGGPRGGSPEIRPLRGASSPGRGSRLPPRAAWGPGQPGACNSGRRSCWGRRPPAGAAAPANGAPLGI